MYTIIVGGGKVGSYLASLLLIQKHQLKVIECRKDRIALLEKSIPSEMLLLGSGSDPNVLDAAGIRKANVVSAVTGSDETNLVVCSLARQEFNCPRVIARVNNPKNAWLYTPYMGVDVALNQADLLAHLISEEMSIGDMMTLMKLRRGQFSLVEVIIPPGVKAASMAIKDLPLPQECVIVAIFRKSKMIIPRGPTIMEVGDEVLIIADKSGAEQVAELFSVENNINGRLK